MASPIVLLKHWLGILGYQAVAFLTVMATTLIAGIAVPPNVWGHYFLLLSLVQIVSGIGLSWVSQSVLLFARAELHRSGGLRETLWSALSLQALIFALLVAVGWLVRPHAVSLIALGPAAYCLVALAVLLTAAFETLAYVLQADNRFQGLGFGAAIGKLGPLFAACAVWAGAPATAEVLLTGLVGGLAVGFATTACALPPRKAAAAGPTLAAVREIVSYGARLPLAIAAGVASAWMHVWFVRVYAGASEAGIYGWAASLYALVAAGLMPLSAVMAPHLADLALTGQQAQSQVRAGMFLAVVTLAAIALPGVLGLLRLASLALPARYAASGPLLVMLFAAVPALVTTYLATPMLKGYPDQISKFVTANVVMAAANVVLNLVLTTRFGGDGAALSLVLATWTGAIVIDRQTRVAIGAERPARRRATAILVASAAGSVASAFAANALDVATSVPAGLLVSAALLAVARRTGHLRDLGPAADHMTFLPHRLRRALTRFLV